MRVGARVLRSKAMLGTERKTIRDARGVEMTDTTQIANDVTISNTVCFEVCPNILLGTSLVMASDESMVSCEEVRHAKNP